MEMDSLLTRTPKAATVDEALLLVSGTKFSARLWFLCGLTQFADACELLLLSFLASEIRCPFHLNTYDITLLQTCVLIGMLLGSNATGILSDKSGRRPAVLLSLICTVVGGLSSTFASNFITILGGRFIVGLGVGSAPVALTLFTDFLPSNLETETRGRTLVGFFFFFSLGALFESLVAWATLSTFWHWRALLFVSVLPSVILLFLSLFLLPESPRWLVSNGHSDRALKTLCYVSKVNHQRNLLSEITILVNDNDRSQGKNIMRMKDKGVRINDNRSDDQLSSKTTITLSVLFFLMASLYYSIVLVGTSIVNDDHYNNSIIILNQTCGGNSNFINNTLSPTHTRGEFISLVVTNSAELPGLWIAYILLDRIGRQKTIQLFFISCGVFCSALLVSTLFSGPCPLWIRTFIVFGARGAALGFNQSLWIYTALFFKTKVRNTGIGFTTSFARIGSLLAPIIVNIGGQNGLTTVAALCVGLSFISFITVNRCLPKDDKK